MHVIEAIGIGEPKNMSSIARELSVTVGTLTIAMNSLVKKGYVERSRGPVSYTHLDVYKRQGQDGIFRGNQQRKIQEKGSSGRQVKAGVPYHQEKRTGRHRKCDGNRRWQAGCFRRADVYDWLISEVE